MCLIFFIIYLLMGINTAYISTIVNSKEMNVGVKKSLKYVFYFYVYEWFADMYVYEHLGCLENAQTRRRCHIP